jgi:ankyrin repeat protein
MLALTAPAGARTPVSAVVAEACAAGGPVASLLHELAAHGAVGSLAWLLRALHTAVSATTPAPAEARARLRSLLEARDAAGRTPLAVAAAAGHTSVITLLLAPRAAAETDPASVPAAAADSVAAALPACIPVADVNAPDRCGLTPLLHAAWHGHAVAAAALVALGACADTVTPAAQTLATLTADDETRAAVTAALAARSERRRAVAAALASATQDVGVSNLVVAKIASFVE